MFRTLADRKNLLSRLFLFSSFLRLLFQVCVCFTIIFLPSFISAPFKISLFFSHLCNRTLNLHFHNFSFVATMDIPIISKSNIFMKKFYFTFIFDVNAIFVSNLFVILILKRLLFLFSFNLPMQIEMFQVFKDIYSDFYGLHSHLLPISQIISFLFVFLSFFLSFSFSPKPMMANIFLH